MHRTCKDNSVKPNRRNEYIYIYMGLWWPPAATYMRPGAPPQSRRYVCTGPGEVSSLVTDPPGTPVTPCKIRSFTSIQMVHTHTYTQTLAHTQTLSHTNALTHKHFYTQTLLHTKAFTHRRFYTLTLLHTDAFTHRRFYTQTRLHTDAFTHRHFCTQTLLHTDAFTY